MYYGNSPCQWKLLKPLYWRCRRAWGAWRVSWTRWGPFAGRWPPTSYWVISLEETFGFKRFQKMKIWRPQCVFQCGFQGRPPSGTTRTVDWISCFHNPSWSQRWHNIVGSVMTLVSDAVACFSLLFPLFFLCVEGMVEAFTHFSITRVFISLFWNHNHKVLPLLTYLQPKCFLLLRLPLKFQPYTFLYVRSKFSQVISMTLWFLTVVSCLKSLPLQTFVWALNYILF